MQPVNIMQRLCIQHVEAVTRWPTCCRYLQVHLRNENFRISGFIEICCQGSKSWWRHQMGIFSAVLAPCAGNSPVTGEFPSQRPLMRSVCVFWGLNKRLSKLSRRWWFETQSRSLWRHCNFKSALFRVRAWRRADDKPLYEPMASFHRTHDAIITFCYVKMRSRPGFDVMVTLFSRHGPRWVQA